MRTRLLRWLAPAVLVLAIPSLGHAGTINIVGGTAGTVPAGSGLNNFIGPTFFPGPSIGGFFGSRLDVNVTGPSIVTIDFFGAEADFSNQFDLGAVQIFDHAPGTLISPNPSSPLGTFSAPLLGLGLLAFRFDIHSHTGFVDDGANPIDLHLPNFFVSCNPFSSAPGAGGTTCNQVWVLLDDSGGGFDADFDDMVLRVSVTEMPEPATLALLGFGLIGGGWIARRRRK